MFTPEELEQHLRQAALHPAEYAWAPQPREGSATLTQANLFRPGEQIGITVHPTNDGPPLPQDSGPEPHRHEFIEIAYVWDGSCEMAVEGSRFSMEPGDLLILDTHSAHQPHVPKGTLLVNLVLQTSFFNDAFFRQSLSSDPLTSFFSNSIYSQKAVKRYLVYQTSNDVRIRQLFSMILQEYFANEVCCKDIIENLVRVLFSTIVRLQLQKSVCVTLWEDRNDAFVSELIGYMQNNLQTVTRDSLADHFGYSYSHITTIVQATTGLSFSELRRTLRIQQAEQFLRTTEAPIAEIAHTVGFSNMTRFYELFRSNYGASPQEYRQSLQA